MANINYVPERESQIETIPKGTHRWLGIPVLKVIENTGMPAKHRDPIRKLLDWWLR